MLFSIGHMSHETMKKKFKTKILNKIKVSSLSEMKSKNYEYLSEFITNIIIIKERKGKSVLYKPLDSTGYDGAFVIKSDVWDLFISETKSSNDNYDMSGNNYLNFKSDEALSDLHEKFKKDNSSSRDADNIAIYDKIFILTKELALDIDDEGRKRLDTQIDNIIENISIDNAISSTVSKHNLDKSNLLSTKSHHFKKVIHNNVILENSEEVFDILQKLVSKLEELYA